MTKIFADCADLDAMLKLADDSRIEGFTTNPTLMRRAGVTNYREFAKTLLDKIKDKPISFEVLSKDRDEMIRQAEEISSWGPNAIVKIPIFSTALDIRKEPWDLIIDNVLKVLNQERIRVNVTAIMDSYYVEPVAKILSAGCDPPISFVSVFAGRIADIGEDPVEAMSRSLKAIKDYYNIRLIWASPREVYNYYQAIAINCHIITMTPSLIEKLELRKKSDWKYSFETCEQFYRDGKESGLTL